MQILKEYAIMKRKVFNLMRAPIFLQKCRHKKPRGLTRLYLGLTTIMIGAAFFVLCLQAVSSYGDVIVNTGKLTITGAPPAPPTSFSPFLPVTITTEPITITGATPATPPPKEPFASVNITTKKLTITGK